VPVPGGQQLFDGEGAAVLFQQEDPGLRQGAADHGAEDGRRDVVAEFDGR
jgi:hypothetical protein